jgi:hypothetical protein
VFDLSGRAVLQDLLPAQVWLTRESLASSIQQSHDKMRNAPGEEPSTFERPILRFCQRAAAVTRDRLHAKFAKPAL